MAPILPSSALSSTPSSSSTPSALFSHTASTQANGPSTVDGGDEGVEGGVDFSGEEEDEWETVGPKNRAAVTRTYATQSSVLSGMFGGMLRSEVRSKGRWMGGV